MKNVIKPLIAAGLVLAGLPIESATALRQAATRVGLAARTAVVATQKTQLRPFIAPFTRTITSTPGNKNQKTDPRSLAQTGKEVRDLHEKSKQATPKERPFLIGTYLEKNIQTLNAQQVCLLTELLPEELETEWTIKTLTHHFPVIQDPNDMLILLDKLPPALKQSWTLAFLSEQFEAIPNYYITSFLDNLTPDQKKDFLLSKINSGIALEKFSLVALTLLPMLSPQEGKALLKKLYEQLLGNKKAQKHGPLFCPEYFATHFEQLPITYNHEPIQQLIPELAEYTAHHYEQGNMVFYHARNSKWRFLTDVYKALYQIRHGKMLPDDYIPLRLTQESLLTSADYQELMTNGDQVGYYRPWILFLNMIPFANQDPGSNSWRYFMDNFDFSTRKNTNSFCDLQKLFTQFDLEEEYESCIKDFEKLFKLYEAAVTKRGNYGELLAIAIPEAVVPELVYSAGIGGFKNPLTINKKKTSNPVIIAKHFDQVPREHQFVLILTNKVLNYLERQKVGITVKAFDPAIYKNTPEAQEYKQELVKVMERVKQLYSAHLATINRSL